MATRTKKDSKRSRRTSAEKTVNIKVIMDVNGGKPVSLRTKVICSGPKLFEAAMETLIRACYAKV